MRNGKQEYEYHMYYQRCAGLEPSTTSAYMKVLECTMKLEGCKCSYTMLTSHFGGGTPKRCSETQGVGQNGHPCHQQGHLGAQNLPLLRRLSNIQQCQRQKYTIFSYNSNPQRVKPQLVIANQVGWNWWCPPWLDRNVCKSMANKIQSNLRGQDNYEIFICTSTPPISNDL